MAKWTRNHKLEIGGVTLLLGVIVTIVAFTFRFARPAPDWLDMYAELVTRPEGDYNVFALIVGPILLLTGGFYVGEQIVLRRRFERLLDTPKKSEFASRRKELDDLSKRLPEPFHARIEAKEAEFKSRRAT